MWLAKTILDFGFWSHLRAGVPPVEQSGVILD